ncbi:MAG: signal peptidase II [Alphaproteobacteria bacterium]|nr:signal peptidase II [Alphaproteobacteria bacterium]
MTRLRGFGIGMALAILVADQISKWWVLEVFDLPARVSVPVLPFLNLTMVWNRGITFGLLSSDSGWGAALLAAVALGVVVALTVWLWQAERMAVALALGAVAGGAVGNVIDRIAYGAVVDFLHAHAWGWSWYVFNVADAAIVCGVGLLLLDSLLAGRKDGAAGQVPGQTP